MKESSQELLAKLEQNDAQAAEAIFLRYTQRLLALAQARLGPKLRGRVEADDVVQSTYRSFFRRAATGGYSVPNPGDLWRLLASITVHKLGRQVEFNTAAKRSVHRECADSVDQQLCLPEPAAADVVATADELRWLLRQLAPQQRRAVEMRLQEFDVEAIAREVACSDRTVRRWLNQARQLLEDRWADQSQRRSPRSTPAATDGTLPLPETARRVRHADYRLERLIGSGGICKVYAATHKQSGAAACIKTLRKCNRVRASITGRFIQEAQMLSELTHPSIVRAHGLGRFPDGGYMMVLDLIDGRSLDHLGYDGGLSPEEAVRIVASVADTIHYVHQQGIIHCDLKPHNIILNSNGQPILADFGFATRAELYSDGSIAGTPAYMAAEQSDPSVGPITVRTDVYGLGATLRQLLTCRAAAATPDRTVLHQTSSELAEICARAMNADPAERFATAEEVSHELRGWLDRQGYSKAHPG